MTLFKSIINYINGSWWLLQVIACLFITVKCIVGRKFHGLSFKLLLIYLVLEAVFIFYPLIRSYQVAQSFYQPYFLSLGLLSIFGIAGNYLIFSDPISITNFLGIFLVLIGSYLISV